MTFNKERFIIEIQKRPCIWDIKSAEYNNRVLRQSAWKEIAQIVYNDRLKNSKSEKVQELQRKWKGLRDYYNREKNKSSSLKNRRAALKKSNTPILDILQFLNVTKTTDQKCSNITNEVTDIIPNETDSEDNQPSLSPPSSPSPSPSSSSIHLNRNTKNTSTLNEVWLKTMKNKRQYDPDMSFLINILPDMKSMTPSQNFDFRFEVMKVIKKIKYSKDSDNYEQLPEKTKI